MKKISTLLCALICLVALAQTTVSNAFRTDGNAQPNPENGAAVKEGEQTFPTIWLLGEMGLDGETMDPDQQVGYRPDVGIKMETTDGVIYTCSVNFWSVGGNPTHHFGFCKKETLGDDPTRWDQIADYRFGAKAPNTTIVWGQTHEVGELLDSKENFFWIATGMYTVTLNMEAKTVVVTPINDYTHVYVMGDGVKGQANAANVGEELLTSDGVNFTKEVVFDAKGAETAAFTFSTKLAETADDWASIAANQFGAQESNTPVVLKTEMELGADGIANAFTIPSGTYEINVNIQTRVIKVNPHKFPPIYVMGQVNGQGWNADQGTAMDTEDGNVYTLTGEFYNESGEATFAFTTGLGGDATMWEQIKDLRFGNAVGGLDPIYFGKEHKLGAPYASKEDWFSVINGKYTITLNKEKNSIVVMPAEGELQHLYILGNTCNIDAEGNKKFQAWAADQGTELFTHDLVNYCGTVLFEDDVTSPNVSFGFSTKLASHFTLWDDIANSRFGALAPDTNVTLDEVMQCGDFLASKENKFWLPMGKYDLTVNLTNRTLLVSKTPYTKLYVMGGVSTRNEDGTINHLPVWPNVGIELTTEDGVTYTGDVLVENESNTAFSNIFFSTKLAGDPFSWGAIAATRFGAVNNGDFLAHNTPVQLGDFQVSGENMAQLRRGDYTFSMNLTERKLTVTPKDPVAVYVIGTTEGKEFAANDGVQILSNDYGKTYVSTEKITFNTDDPQFVISDKLSADAEDWITIEPYVFGPAEDGAAIALETENAMTANPNIWSVQAGSYYVIVDVIANTIKLTEESGVAMNSKANNAVAYPAITTGAVNVKADAIVNVEVYNLSGALVQSVKGNGESTICIDLAGQASGIYLIRINGSQVAKVIKK
ncbi:MAG: T9SS type A sorting domain-containing protein [Bacteroidales bacterium]|nr:T9SS type A sorting domain-containing protein [Bacteroidales bacterium]